MNTLYIHDATSMLEVWQDRTDWFTRDVREDVKEEVLDGDGYMNNYK